MKLNLKQSFSNNQQVQIDILGIEFLGNLILEKDYKNTYILSFYFYEYPNIIHIKTDIGIKKSILINSSRLMQKIKDILNEENFVYLLIKRVLELKL